MEVAEHFGVKPPSVQDWLKRGVISKDKLPELWAYFSDVVGPEHWGLDATAVAGQAKTTTAASFIIGQHPDDELPEGMVAIPEYSLRLSAGPGRPAVSYEIEEMREPATYRLSWLQGEGLNPKHLRRFKVTGESMIPLLYPNDVVLVNLEEGGFERIKDGSIYAILYGEDLRLKRLLFRRGDGTLTLRSENQKQYPDETLTLEQAQEFITVLGRVRDKSGTGGL
ncbi:S24 family peptidase [Vandammella animalimorsus]|uniref:S24 family peptidase n=1 Tax=Vandammella animalimorsus TaxID=2029117 RepID=UPI0011859E39|nr:LexA family transcriptional regulator [Vandammella animalimorsus]